MTSNRGGEDTSRNMKETMNVAVEDLTPENCVINWIKIIALLFFTFALIVIMWAIRYFLLLI